MPTQSFANPFERTIGGEYGLANPLSQAAEGVSFGAGLFALEQNRIALEQQRIAQQKYQELTGRLLSPTATASDFEAAMLFGNKDQAEVIKGMMASRSEASNRALLNQISPIAFSLKTGNKKEGIDNLMALAKANENSGDPEEAKYLRDLAKLAETKPDQVGNLFAGKMTMIPGGKDALEALLKMATEHRTGESDAAFRDIMAGANTVEDVFARIPSLAQLGEKGVEHAERLLTQQRLLEQQRETTAAAQVKRGETKIESLKAINMLNTMIASGGDPAFVVDDQGEVAPNESVWSKYAYIPTAGGPDQAVPGKVDGQRPAAPVIDQSKATALGLDAQTIGLIQAQMAISPKDGARLLADIIKMNIKQRMTAQKPDTPSAHAKMLQEAGYAPGTPEFTQAMRRHVEAATKGAATGGAPVVNVSTGEAQKTRGKEFGQFAQKAVEASENAADVASDVDLVVTGLRGMGGGPVAQFKAWAGTYFPADSAWGKAASMAELASTIQAKLAPSMRAAGSGATSDMEMKMYMRAIPSIATTEAGRELMLKYANRVAERAQVRAEIVNDIESAGKLPSPAEISKRMKQRLGDQFFDEKDKAFFGMKSAPGQPSQVTVKTPDGKTFNFPTQAQADEFKRRAGIK